MNAVDHFQLLEAELAEFRRLGDQTGPLAFLGQEAMRFYSVAGSLRQTFQLENAIAEERYITHILGRSLLEGFFWLTYVFEDSTLRAARFAEKLDAFKGEYHKYWGENLLPGRAQLEPADPGWAGLRARLDVKSMLGQVRNDDGDRLSYLYFVYRVASFDTHGNSLRVFFDEAFGRACNFSALDFRFGFDLMANHYLVILQRLRAAGEA